MGVTEQTTRQLPLLDSDYFERVKREVKPSTTGSTFPSCRPFKQAGVRKIPSIYPDDTKDVGEEDKKIIQVCVMCPLPECELKEKDDRLGVE